VRMEFESAISSAIVRNFCEKLEQSLVLDVAIVGGGPSGLVAAKYLADSGLDVAIFESSLAPGGGVWGGGMLFNEIIVQQEVLTILDEFGISYKSAAHDGLYTLDSVEMASGLIFGAKKAGVNIFNSMTVEDIVFKKGRVNGLVINWTNVKRLDMPVDPLTVLAEAVLDGTGHPSEVAHFVTGKAGVALSTETGGIVGEKPMWAENGEASTVEATREYYPGFFASGMAANNISGGYRMGPIFGGMLLSGCKAAALIGERFSNAGNESGNVK